MRVHGDLLTPEDREQTKAHFWKNDGMEWDLHEMSQYIQKGFEAVESDPEASEQTRLGLRRVCRDGKYGRD